MWTPQAGRMRLYPSLIGLYDRLPDAERFDRILYPKLSNAIYFSLCNLAMQTSPHQESLT